MLKTKGRKSCVLFQFHAKLHRNPDTDEKKKKSHSSVCLRSIHDGGHGGKIGVGVILWKGLGDEERERKKSQLLSNN